MITSFDWQLCQEYAISCGCKYCMKFITFLCVTFQLFSLSFVLYLALHLACTFVVCQDGLLYLIVTQNGRVVQRMSIASAGRLDDGRPHRVTIDRRNRTVSGLIF